MTYERQWLLRTGRAILTTGIFVSLGEGLQAHQTSESISRWEVRGQRVHATIIISRREAGRVIGNALSKTKAAQQFLNYSKDKILLHHRTGECKPLTAKPMPATGDYIRLEKVYQCPADLKPSAPATPDLGYTLTIELLMDAVSFHTHFARWNNKDARFEFIFRADRRRQSVGYTAQQQKPAPLAYAAIGIEHIAFGYDHLVFLSLVLLLAGSVKRSLLAVTGFTIGHSLSLGLAALHLVQVDTGAVEALIGLTIVVGAVELAYPPSKLHIPALALSGGLLVLGAGASVGFYNSTVAGITYLGMGTFIFSYLGLVRVRGSTVVNSAPTPASRTALVGPTGISAPVGSSDSPVPVEPPGPSDPYAPGGDKGGHWRQGHFLIAMTILFGFVHGFGFAGFLLDVGLPDDSLLSALLFFNLGIEAGQLAIGAGLLAFAHGSLRLWPGLRTIATKPALAGLLGGAGAFWFLSRAL